MKIPLPSVKKKARIEIIPLIDIVFFLLATFVMVSMSMIKNQGISVNLPKAATGTAQERKTSATVTVTQAGWIYLNKERMSLDELRAHLQKMKAAEPDLRVFIHGDENASFGTAVQVLDEVRKMGIQKVSIQTQAQKS